MERKTICVTNLFLDLDNFRFEHQNSQRVPSTRWLKPIMMNYTNWPLIS